MIKPHFKRFPRHSMCLFCEGLVDFIVCFILKLYNYVEVIFMINGFEIVDGKLFVDKELFRQAQLTDNNLSKLTGNDASRIFKKKPRIYTGIESVTIDYHGADQVPVPRDINQFINEIKESYHYKVRGSIKVAVNEDIFNVVINTY